MDYEANKKRGENGREVGVGRSHDKKQSGYRECQLAVLLLGEKINKASQPTGFKDGH
jgi:hypothetical protein